MIGTALFVIAVANLAAGAFNKGAELTEVRNLTKSKGVKAPGDEEVGYFIQKDYLFHQEDIDAIDRNPIRGVLADGEVRAKMLLVQSGLAEVGPCGHLHPKK